MYSKLKFNHSSMPAEGSGDIEGPGTVLLAGFWWRSLAAQIDFVIFYLLLSLVIVITRFSVDSRVYEVNVAWMQFTIFGLVSIVYYPVCESSRFRGTLGKKVLGLSVVTLSNERVTFVRAMIRHLLRCVSGFLLMSGFVITALTARKQSAHDLATRVLVIRRNRDLSVRPVLPRTVWLSGKFNRYSTQLIAVSSCLLAWAIVNILIWLIAPLLLIMEANQKVNAAIGAINSVQVVVEREMMSPGARDDSAVLAAVKSANVPPNSTLDFSKTEGRISVLFSQRSSFPRGAINSFAIKSPDGVHWTCEATNIPPQLLRDRCASVSK